MARPADGLVESIHASPRRGVLTVAGGGSATLSDLLGVAGASATVLEANIPYAAESLSDWLGFEPKQACSDETARAMAMRAFIRSLELEGDFGFAVTASLRTTRPKRGPHRAHIAFQDASTTRTWTVPLDKDARPRSEEERLVADTALTALAKSLDVGEAPEVPGCDSRARPGFADLMLGNRTHVGPSGFDGLLPGAFNPLHEGHESLRDDASRRLGCPIGYELSIANVDKPPLDYQDLNQRLDQFDPDDIVVTNAPTFVDKARVLGGIAFAVGIDTIERIAAPRYYDGVGERDAALVELAERGSTFLVYGRADAGTFKCLDDLDLPPTLARLCTGVPEDEFRIDVSSTRLRRARSR